MLESWQPNDTWRRFVALTNEQIESAVEQPYAGQVLGPTRGSAYTC